MVVLASALVCLAMNVFFEARGEVIPGQYAVALVTMNRADHDPKKVCQEVTKPKQFSWTSLYLQRRRGSFSVKQEYVMKDEDSWTRAMKIARVVLAGRFPDITHGATYYHATYVHPEWRKEVVYREQIGNHLFYSRLNNQSKLTDRRVIHAEALRNRIRPAFSQLAEVQQHRPGRA